MKIKLETSVNITHHPGEIVEVDDERAKAMIELGMAKKLTEKAVIKEKTRKAIQVI